MYRWHYTTAGNPDLPPLLLLHGWMGSSEDYRAVIESIYHHYYCLAIDLPGHGKTQIIDAERGYEFINTARGIVELLDSLNISKCAIAGYSFGGRLALYLALEYPARFDRAIVESASPGLTTNADKQARITSDNAIIQRLQQGNFPQFLEDWYRQPIFEGISNHPDFDRLLQHRLTNQPELLAKSLQYAGLAQQPHLGERLTQHQQPILLIAGAGDRKFVALNRALNLQCTCTTLTIVPDCSHNVHFSSPKMWAHLVIQFLRSSPIE